MVKRWFKGESAIVGVTFGKVGEGGNDGGCDGGSGDNAGVDRSGVEVKREVGLNGVEVREGLVVVGNEKLDGNEKADGAGVFNPVSKPPKSKVDDDSLVLAVEEKRPLKSQVAGRNRGVRKITECASSGFDELS